MSTTSVPIEERETGRAFSNFNEICQIQDVNSLICGLKGITHYEVLNVPMDAGRDEIKAAYRRMAKRFHPDKILEKEEKLRHEAIFARIVHSYESLSNPLKREAYDRRLRRCGANAAHRAASPLNPAQVRARKMQAANLLKKAIQLNSCGDVWAAICHLKSAVQLDPTHPTLHFELGKALASNSKWRREAEASLRAAIRADPWRGDYYVALGNLYRDQGLSVRAVREYKRALWLDPDNRIVKRILDEMLAGRRPRTPLESIRRLLGLPFTARKKEGLTGSMARGFQPVGK